MFVKVYLQYSDFFYSLISWGFFLYLMMRKDRCLGFTPSTTNQIGHKSMGTVWQIFVKKNYCETLFKSLILHICANTCSNVYSFIYNRIKLADKKNYENLTKKNEGIHSIVCHVRFIFVRTYHIRISCCMRFICGPFCCAYLKNTTLHILSLY